MIQKKLLFTITFILIFLGLQINTFAEEIGFSTEEFTESERVNIVENINILVMYEEPEKQSIECFDVNENGMIVIGSSSFKNKTICIYDSDGFFQYGYRFKVDGSFGVEWCGENIIIYIVRGDIAIYITPDGNIDNILKIQNTIENNSYWNHSVFSVSKTTNHGVYHLKNDMGFLNLFASSYSQLIVESNGNQTVLYDVNSEQMIEYSIVFALALSFVAISMVFILRNILRKFKKKTEKTGDGSLPCS